MFFRKPLEMPTRETALPGRETPLRTECSRKAVPDTIREIVHSLEP